MKAPWRYWQLVRLTMQGKRQVDEVFACRDCLDGQFPEADAADAVVQRRLMALMVEPLPSAEGCLRCYISHEIDRACKDLFVRFGKAAGIPYLEELLTLVLLDSDPLRQRPTTPSLADDPTPAGKVLRTFDPDKAQLNTWTKRVVISDRALSHYLQDHGVYLDSDWSLLNGLSAKKLRRLLSEEARVDEAVLQRAEAILQSYQEVYRRDRVASRSENRLASRAETANRSRCEPPTPKQLERMVAYLQQQGISDLTAEVLLAQLEQWARLMRRSRHPSTVSIDTPETQQLIDTVESDAPTPEEQEAAANQQAFLQSYRDALLKAMDGAIAQTLSHRVATLSQRKPAKDGAFLEGLHRFFCRGESMGAIAPHIGLTAQYQVTRLLNIKALRADIRREMQHTLRQRIGELAQQYVEASDLDDALDAALDAELERLFSEAEAESFNAYSDQQSLLSQRLCDYLAHRSD
ncbi:MAG: hypothetical protein AAFX78_13065 [Cyanobacteria bacterium J06638_20]